jgi:hypothetical protein
VNAERPSGGDYRRVRRALLRGTPVSPEDLPIAERLLAHMPRPLSPRHAVMLAIGVAFLLGIGGMVDGADAACVTWSLWLASVHGRREPRAD